MFFRKKTVAPSWIVVFLGNPGQKYEGTRHNAGFMAADAVEKNKGVKISRLKFKALTAQCSFGSESVLLMKPQTFMNLSGDAVSQAMKFYKIPLDHIIVVSDDISMAAGKLRIRRSGSAGGHNGLKDIIAKCGGDGFPRIKIGVGAPPHPDYDIIDWVLGVPRGDDAKLVEEAVKTAADAVESIIVDGIDRAMNKYSQK